MIFDHSRAFTTRVDVLEYCVSIEYTGAAADLIEARAIEPHMATPGHRGVRCVDSEGDKYSRCPAPQGLIRVDRLITDLDRARRMPGVSPDLVANWLERIRAHPDRVIEEPGLIAGTSIYYGTESALQREGLLDRARGPLLGGIYKAIAPARDCQPPKDARLAALIEVWLQLEPFAQGEVIGMARESLRLQKVARAPQRPPLRLVVNNRDQLSLG